MEFLSMVKRSWFFALLTAVVVGFALFKFTGRFKKDTAVNYIAAVTTFSKWKKEGNGADLSKLKELMNKQPELRSRFEASIGQHLLIKGQREEAASFISSVLKRTRETLSVYRRFAEISLLVHREELAHALEESKKLQQLLANQRELELLEAYNLLRIAVLEQEIGSSQEELQTWNKLKGHPAFVLVDQSIYKDSLSLADYVKYRESLLMQRIERAL
jgi:hypothetical protein